MELETLLNMSTSDIPKLPSVDAIKQNVTGRLLSYEINKDQAKEIADRYKADVKKFGYPLSKDELSEIDLQVQEKANEQNVYPTGHPLKQKSLDSYREMITKAALYRKNNPEEMAIIDGITPTNAFFIGVGEGMTKIKNFLTGKEMSEDEKNSMSALKQLTSNVGAVRSGELVGETAPFVAAGAPLSGLGTGLRVVGGAALGGVEGAAISKAEGLDPLTWGAIGAATPVVGEVVLPLLAKLVNVVNRKVTGKAIQKTTASGKEATAQTPTEIMESSGADKDQMLKDVQTLMNSSAADGEIVTTVEELATVIKENGVNRDHLLALASKPDLDQETLAAAERLGLAGDLPISAMSKNQQYIELEQGLTSVTASETSAKQVAGIAAVNQKADDLITELGGSINKSDVSGRIADSVEGTVTSLQEQADGLYDLLKGDKGIPGAHVVDDLSQLEEMISNKLAKVGGQVDELPPVFQRLMRFFEKDADGNPLRTVTYEMIDDERKKVGAALSKKGSMFDTGEPNLAEAYGALTETQGTVTELYGLRNVWEEGKKLIVKRKGIEDKAVEIFGKNMQKAVIPKLSNSMLNMQKGSMANEFENIMSGIPKEQQGEAVATALNGVFTAGSRQTQMNFGGFVDWYEKMLRQPQDLNRITSYLPEGGAERLGDLFTVAKGFRTALASKSNTGKVMSLITNLDKPNGIIDKLYNLGGSVMSGSPAGGGAVSTIIKAASKEKQPLSVAADKLISSNEFKRFVIASSTNPNSRKAQQGLKAVLDSKSYNEWANQLPAKIRANMLTAGFTGWLIGNVADKESTLPRGGQTTNSRGTN